MKRKKKHAKAKAKAKAKTKRPEPLLRSVHVNIKRLRLGQALTQTALGELIGTDNTVISHWENGFGSPRTATLPNVAKALGVTVDELLAEAS